MRKRMILWGTGLMFMFLMASLLVQPWSKAEGAHGVSELEALQALSFDCSTVSEIPETECNALVALYKGTNGANWANNDGWLSNNTPCNWTGVQCSEEHVSEIVLEQNQLTGAIPAELGDLGQLTWLQLNNNQLNGTIPPELGNLLQVTWLRLEDNQLSGHIPAELGNITALESLYLAGNPLSGSIPPQLGNLANLRKLYLDHSNLNGAVPSELGNLSQLDFLILNNTSLSGPLPLSFTNLTNLSYFHFLETALCEPTDAAFQVWIDSLEFVYSPDVACQGDSTATPSATATATVTNTPDGTTTPAPTNSPTTPASTNTPSMTPTATSTIPPTTGTGLCEGLIVDQNPHPMSPLSKPGYLQAIIDPAFGTTIRRISDIEATVTGEQAVIKPMYNTVQGWNADESYLLLYQRGGIYHLLDGMTYQPIRELDIRPADIEEVFWDFNDPDILYYVETQDSGARLIRYRVSSDTREVVRSFADVCGEASVEGGNDVQMMSWDSDVIGLRCTNDPAQLFGYRISTDTLTPIITSGQGNPFTPWVAPQAAPSGNLYYLDDRVLDSNMNIVRTLNMDSPEHASLGMFANGDDGLFTVAFAEGPTGGCGAGALIAHDLTNGTCRTLVGQENGYPYPPSDTHPSALSYLNPGWVAVSMIGVANGGQTAQAGQEVLDNELLLVDSAQGGEVCRVGHHRSFGDGSQFGYWSEPHVVISPSGTRLLFGSDWQGGASVDSYVVELPAYSSPPQLPTPGPGTVPSATATPTSTPSPTVTPITTPTETPSVSPTLPPSTGVDLCEGLISDQNNYPMSPFAKPGYLETAVDPEFGTTIRRISDIEATVTGDQAVIKPIYNTVQAWNANESYLLLYQRGGIYHLLDGITYQPIRELDIRPADIEEVFWDFNDPDILYYVETEDSGARLIRYRVSSDTREVLRSFADVCGDASVEGGNDVQMMSWDSDVIGLRCTNEPAQLFGYRISTDTLTPIITSGQGNPFTPWVAPQAAPSGNLYYLDDRVLDSNMNIVRTLNMDSPEHASLGMFANGDDGLFTVAFAEGPTGGCGAGALIAHDLTNGTCRTLVGQENGYPYPPSDTHPSALSYLNPGWVAVSMIGVANGGQTAQAGQEVLDNELILADSSPGGEVCRVAHHRSFGDGGQFGYWSEPHVVISPSGTRLLFGSDWQGGASVDSYVVELPSYTGAPPIAPNTQRLFLPLIIR
ncbi:MAG: hypothetical protein ACPGWR_08130 [Ardenticatenaceae bacterium]